MKTMLTFKNRLLFTGVVSILMWAFLAWDHFHGGVPTHYILHNDDYPGFSNWWGAITIPLVTWGLLHLINRRVHNQEKDQTSSILYGFIGHLVFAVVLSYFFITGSDMPGYLALGHIALSFFIPLYRAECLLGYILGMVFIFGSILPLLFAIFLWIIFTITYKLPRIIIAFAKKKKYSSA